jgi:hypothetical protein
VLRCLIAGWLVAISMLTSSVCLGIGQMDDAAFWAIVEKVKRDDGDDAHARRLESALRELPEQDILAFGRIFQRFESRAKEGDVWAAANLVLARPCADDCFLYFRRWLVSRGRQFYAETVQNPDSLAGKTTATTRDAAQFESFAYAIVTAFEGKSGKSYYKALQSDAKDSDSSILEWGWQDYPPSKLATLLPKLWSKYGGEFQARLEEIEGLKAALLPRSLQVVGVGTVSIGSIVKHPSLGRGVVRSLGATNPPVANIEFPSGLAPIVLTREFISLEKK